MDDHPMAVDVNEGGPTRSRTEARRRTRAPAPDPDRDSSDPGPRRLPIVVGTAGHVDHGKTALVKAITGVDTDRLPEEKAREISIELGFAPLRLPDGAVCAVVDVPGHERFIKNMLAGATGFDVALLCVDVREGVRPQTREHLDILGLVGVRAGVAALTKIDTVAAAEVVAAAEDASAAEVASAAEALASYLKGTVLAGCPIIPVSAKTGAGLDRLLAELAAAVAAAERSRPPAVLRAPARLAVDRAFTVAGFGVVVTGTVAAGRIAVGDRLQVYPSGPVVRVRRLEVFGAAVPEVQAGERAALNLSGDLGGLGPGRLRGSVLAAPGTMRPSNVVGLGLRMLPDAEGPADLERVRLHTGTSETLGRLILLNLDGLRNPAGPRGALRRPGEPVGEPVPVLFEAETPLAVAPGQPFVIRSYSPARTVGGGMVLAADLGPVTAGRPRSKAGRSAARAAILGPEEDAAASPGSVPAPAAQRDRPRVPGGFAPLAEYVRLLGGDRTGPTSGPRGPGGPGGPGGPAVLGGAPAAPPLPPGVRLLAGGRYVAEEDFFASVRDEVGRWLREQHEARPHLASLGREGLWSRLKSRGLPPGVWLESLAADGLLSLRGGRVSLAGWQPRRPAELVAAAAALEAAVRAGGMSPPGLEEVSARLGLAPELTARALETLLLDGVLVCPTGPAGALAGDPVFHAEAVAEARRRLEEYLDRHGEIAVAAFRDLLGSTRKYVLPLLEYFDREKVTLRRGDVRVKHPVGPAAAWAAAGAATAPPAVLREGADR